VRRALVDGVGAGREERIGLEKAALLETERDVINELAHEHLADQRRNQSRNKQTEGTPEGGNDIV
jgi:hypothetical protein